MELKIKKIFLKSYILNTENQTEFIIKKNLKTYGEYSVCNSSGEIVYSVKIDPKPLDKRIKYVSLPNTKHKTNFTHGQTTNGTTPKQTALL